MLSHMLRAASNKELNVTYLGRFNSSSAAGTTISFSSVYFGAEDSNRRIYITASALPNAASLTTLTSATIGGNAATIVAEDPSSSTIAAINGLIAIDLPTGTSGTVTLTFTANVAASSGVLFVYRVVNQVSSIASALVQEIVALSGSVTSVSSSVNTAAGGFMIGWLGTSASTAGITYTNMPINSGTGTTNRFSGLQTNTSGSATTYGFSWTTATSTKRYFVSLKR